MGHVATLIIDGVDQAGELPGADDVRNEEMGAYGVIGRPGLAEPSEDPEVRGIEVLGPAIGYGFGSPATTLEVQVYEEPVGGDDGVLGAVLANPGTYVSCDFDGPSHGLCALQPAPIGAGIHLLIKVVERVVNGGHGFLPAGGWSADDVLVVVRPVTILPADRFQSS